MVSEGQGDPGGPGRREEPRVAAVSPGRGRTWGFLAPPPLTTTVFNTGIYNQEACEVRGEGSGCEWPTGAASVLRCA